MGSRGPKPTPKALKILAGVTRADRLNDAEPRPLEGIPDPPEILDADARAEWARIAPQLAAMRVLSEVDGAALALYCSHYSRWVQAERVVREKGPVIATGTGSFKVSPHLTIAAAAMQSMLKILAEFGATPSSRSRVKAADQAEPEDELTAFLRSG